MRILIAEDEVELANALSAILKHNHFSTDVVYNGEDALDYLETGLYDAAILDIMMPKMDGITALKIARSGGVTTPVLILTAKSEIEDKVTGLDSGANDYLTKPFDMRELLARIRVLTRQTATTDDNIIRCANISLNRATFELNCGNESIRLVNKEFQMLEMFMTNQGTVIPTERFIEKIWGYDSDVELNVVWVYISNLRKKLTSLGAKATIKAARNVGYVMEETNG